MDPGGLHGRFTEVFAAFDEADAWMRAGTTRDGMEFVESGLDVPYDVDSVKELREAVRARSLSELIEGWSYLRDQAANKDW